MKFTEKQLRAYYRAIDIYNGTFYGELETRLEVEISIRAKKPFKK